MARVKVEVVPASSRPSLMPSPSESAEIGSVNHGALRSLAEDLDDGLDGGESVAFEFNHVR